MTRIALITGANRGLGLEIARLLGQAGVTPVIGARDPGKGREAAGVLRNEGLGADWVALDVDSASSVKLAAKEVEARYGRLDILVNNAGILPEATGGAAPEAVDLDMFTRTFGTNVFGAVSVIQEFLPLLRASDSGRIVNVSSTMGSLSNQSDPASPWYEVVVPAYIASKAALNAVTVTLAKLLRGTPIKVNSICPGWVQTDLGGPDNRAAAPLTTEEAAPIAAQMALLPEDGPTGRFVDRNGAVAW
ncbi:MAG TPA: SDR family oxidoreductase [Acidimicrobiia bacterium]|nr:SDR family oxidoreductase [Acidimicrobiia bacterium]